MNRNSDSMAVSPRGSGGIIGIFKRNSEKNSDVIAEESIATGVNLVGIGDLFLLGIAIVIGGQYFGWNSGLEMGFGSYLVAFSLIAFGYLALTLCLAELASCVSFGGGGYAYVRLTTTHYLGHLVGCLEIAEYIMYTSASVDYFSESFRDIVETSSDSVFIFDVCVYVFGCAIIICGKKLVWPVVRFLGVFSLVIILIYIFGSLPWCDFSANASSGIPYFNGMNSFMKNIPSVMWFYIGIEAINNATFDAKEPIYSVPKGYVICMSTLLATSIGVLFVACSLQPIAKVADVPSPLDYGFKKIFLSSKFSESLEFPAMIATIFGFMYAYSKRINSLGKSSLIPNVLGMSLIQEGSEDVAVVCGSLVSLGCIFIFRQFDAIDSFVICILATCITYCMSFVSYIIFYIEFQSFDRKFKSFLGLPGAVAGILIFSFVFVAAAAFQPTQASLCVFLVFIFICFLYYFAISRHKQFFSNEEKNMLIPFYIIKHNLKKNNRSSGRKSGGSNISNNFFSSIPVFKNIKNSTKVKDFQLSSSGASIFEDFPNDDERTAAPPAPTVRDAEKVLVSKVIDGEVLNQLHRVQSTKFETD